jgi:pyrroline-5-carboxylate reductase
VTSPGGPTEAALREFMTEDRLEKLVTQAVRAATRRAGELSKSR